MDVLLDEAIDALAAALHELPQDVHDSVRIDRLRSIEDVIAALSAAQARETVAFMDSQREQRRAQGVVASRLDRGLSAQVGLARRVSPHQAARYVKACVTLVEELPETLAAVEAGRTNLDRALIVAQEAALVRRESRGELDTTIAPQLSGMGDRETRAEAQRLGPVLDPAGAAARAAKAEQDRNVSLRLVEDTMVRLAALVPGVQGVAAFQALQQAAEQAKAAGDPRNRAQIITDTMIERITGQTTASDVPVQLNLVTRGIAPLVLPVELARRAMLDRSGKTKTFIRRLYRNPTTNQLAAMDSKARQFPANQSRFLILRDQHCRTPYCGAPIRHADHVHPA